MNISPSAKKSVRSKEQDFKDLNQNEIKRKLTSSECIDDEKIDSKKKIKSNLIDDEILDECHGFFLTKIKSNKNERWRNVISLDEIFDERNGTIVESIHFSYLYDIEW